MVQATRDPAPVPNSDFFNISSVFGSGFETTTGFRCSTFLGIGRVWFLCFWFLSISSFCLVELIGFSIVAFFAAFFGGFAGILGFSGHGSVRFQLKKTVTL